MDAPVKIRIRALATGGDGLGHPVSPGVEGPQTYFVPETLPDEEVWVRPLSRGKGHVMAELVDVETPSPLRVRPPCKVAAICGGCGWQHVAPEAQLELKRVMVADALRKLGVEPVLGEAPPVKRGLGYRRRARLHYRKVDGQLHLGFCRRRSREIVDLTGCPVLEPSLNHALGRLRLAAAALPTQGEVLLLGAHKQVIVGLPGVRPGPELLAALQGCLDEVLVGVDVRGGRHRQVVGQSHLMIDGTSAVAPVEASAFVFAQAQALGNRALVRHVMIRAKADGQRVLELHAGAGNFSRALARVAHRVWASDDDREAVGLLRKLAERASLPINAKHSDVAGLLPRIAGGEVRYPVIVADPPRTGLGKDVARAMAAVATERIVLVACDAAALARDLGELVGAGWAVDEVAVFDLMPMTPEVEMVATLRPQAR